MTITFVNSGKTPAKNVTLSDRYRYSPVPLSGPSEEDIALLSFHPTASIAPQQKVPETFGYVVKSGDISSQSDVLGQQDIRNHFTQIMDGSVILYYFGTLRYDDAFGKSHATNFCVFIADAKLKLVGICRNFNDLN